MHIIFRILEEIHKSISINLKNVKIGIGRSKVIQDIIRMVNVRKGKIVISVMDGMNYCIILKNSILKNVAKESLVMINVAHFGIIEGREKYSIKNHNHFRQNKNFYKNFK